MFFEQFLYSLDQEAENGGEQESFVWRMHADAT